MNFNDQTKYAQHVNYFDEGPRANFNRISSPKEILVTSFLRSIIASQYLLLLLLYPGQSIKLHTYTYISWQGMQLNDGVVDTRTFRLTNEMSTVI